jgi:pimeloyl-ACP methyl ester carboxylesterase
MSDFVLVPGAWLGGWCWRPVAERLRELGRGVHPVTLTGLGERVHLGAPHTNLDTHIADVTNLILYEGLQEVALLGHSYAGAVVTGVADRIPDRISRVIYLDSGPLPAGTSYLEGTQAPEERSLTERTVVEQGDGWRLPMPPWEELGRAASLAGLTDGHRELMETRGAPQPFGTYTQRLVLGNAAREALPKLLISCSLPLARVRELIASGHPWFRELAGPEWRFAELPTGHWPMFSTPRELADLLAAHA